MEKIIEMEKGECTVEESDLICPESEEKILELTVVDEFIEER